VKGHKIPYSLHQPGRFLDVRNSRMSEGFQQTGATSVCRIFRSLRARGIKFPLPFRFGFRVHTSTTSEICCEKCT